ncbi:flagellar hook-basal body complex protein FliE [Coprothermobacteraceae bacterium]|nr:flagellar hook-basal body complex protein FliE [Coprothermobacteraceae bacterium]
MDALNRVNPITPIANPATKVGQVGESFAKLIDELTAKEAEQEAYRKAIAQGNMDVLPEALVSATEFQLGILMVTQIRNQLVNAFQEFMRLPL